MYGSTQLLQLRGECLGHCGCARSVLFLFFAYVTSLGMLLSEVIANAEALLSQWFGIKTLLLLRAICHHLARLLSEKQEYTGVAFEQLLLEEAAKHNRVCRGPNWLTSMELDSIRHGVKGVVRAYDALQLSRCCACATTHNLFSSRDQHRQYYETGLCYHCFAALERDDEHALTRCIALAEDATKLGKLLVLLTKWNPARGGMMVPADRIDAWNNITIIDMRSWIFWFGNAP